MRRRNKVLAEKDTEFLITYAQWLTTRNTMSAYRIYKEVLAELAFRGAEHQLPPAKALLPDPTLNAISIALDGR